MVMSVYCKWEEQEEPLLAYLIDSGEISRETAEVLQIKCMQEVLHAKRIQLSITRMHEALSIFKNTSGHCIRLRSSVSDHSIASTQKMPSLGALMSEEKYGNQSFKSRLSRLNRNSSRSLLTDLHSPTNSKLEIPLAPTNGPPYPLPSPLGNPLRSTSRPLPPPPGPDPPQLPSNRALALRRHLHYPGPAPAHPHRHLYGPEASTSCRHLLQTKPFSYVFL
ncbi:RNA-binding KH domain-containing protein [Striga asiatica]|uniref:RNA-binding KH domain-containing protein n=1 Tax=Striga asiatica TaxID=4170 RepID=A0A5A7PQ03_STRAF|nr:RNA-binding KH domain-containing protein [Striga asiatica]